MKNLQKMLLASVLIVLNLLSAYSRENLEIRQIESPQHEVNNIFEDSRGFVWITTLEGLYRYDGYSYKAYQKDLHPKSISTNMSYCVNEDHHGNIWIGTYGRGLSCFNPLTETFTNYSFEELFNEQKSTSNDILTIEIDRFNNVWAATWSEVIKLKIDSISGEIENKTRYSWVEGSKIVNRDFIKKIHEDKSGNIWIIGNLTVRRVLDHVGDEMLTEDFNVRGCDIEDFEENSVIVVGDDLNVIEKIQGRKNYKIRTLVEGIRSDKVAYSNNGYIWVGNRSGLIRLAKDAKGTWYEDSRYNKGNVGFNWGTSIVSSLMITKDNQLWIGSRGGGIVTIHENTKEFYNYPNLVESGSLSIGVVKAVYEDSNEKLWIGGEHKGVFTLEKGRSYENGFVSTSVNEADDRAYAFEETGFEEGERNVVWVGTSYPKGLVSLDAKTNKEIVQKFETDLIGFVFALERTDKSTIWAGTYNNGLWRLKIDTQGQIVKADNFVATRKGSTVMSNIVRYLYKDRSGDLWIATDLGVNRIKASELGDESPTFLTTLADDSSKDLNGHYVLQVIDGSDGRMYFGTMGNGLAIYQKDKDSLVFITEKDGLANNTVKTIIQESEDDVVWLSTNKGLSRYKTKEHSVINYTRENGLQENEFAEICGLVRKDGHMVFGNRIGIVVFDPNCINISTTTPKLYFTELYVNNARVEVGDSLQEILKQSIAYTDRISLKYEQRNFTLCFTGINNISPFGNKFEYKLEGLDDKWQTLSVGIDRMIQFTNVPIGEYVLRVRATNSDGIESKEQLALNIEVEPPMYRSNLAYIIYMILIGVILYILSSISKLLIARRQEVALAHIEQNKTEELMKYKLEYYINISHDFRTPLTLINIPLESSMARAEVDNDKVLLKDLTVVKQNVDVLMTLINQLLDFRKIEIGKQNVNLEQVDAKVYHQAYFDLFKPLASKMSIDYTYTTISDNLVINIDERLFEKVIINLLSNSFKYTPPGGRVELIIDKDESRGVLIIKVVDNGVGVKKENLPFLFDRFYQEESPSVYKKYRGSGIGLSLCKSIVELHKGSLDVESQLGEGFVAIVTLPLIKGESPTKSQYFVGVDNEMLEEMISPFQKEKNEKDASYVMHKGLPTLLIVEDNAELRHQLYEKLREEYNVFTAENGQIGFDKCKEIHPHLVLSDIRMPLMDGIEMCRLIKADDEICHTPLLVFTANSTVKAQIDSFTIAGAEGYLDKPFSIEVLKGNIKTILNNRALLQAKFRKQSIIAPEIIAQTQSDLKYLSEIIEIVKRNMSNSELSIEVIANEYGVSRTYLNRKIKAITGETCSQFVRNIRLKYAAKLIMQKQLNVSEVAWEVGYNDINTFRSRFKDMYGVLPSNYNGEEPLQLNKYSEITT